MALLYVPYYEVSKPNPDSHIRVKCFLSYYREAPRSTQNININFFFFGNGNCLDKYQIILKFLKIYIIVNSSTGWKISSRLSDFVHWVVVFNQVFCTPSLPSPSCLHSLWVLWSQAPHLSDGSVYMHADGLRMAQVQTRHEKHVGICQTKFFKKQKICERFWDLQCQEHTKQ